MRTGSGDQTFKDNVTLGADTTLVGGVVSLQRRVDGGFALTVSAALAHLDGDIGLTTPLSSVTPGFGQTYLGTVKTTGAQQYSGPVVVLGPTLVVSTGSGAVDFENIEAVPGHRAELH